MNPPKTLPMGGNADVPKSVSRVATSPIQMQMPCPDCSTPIDLPLARLLTAQPIWCSQCGVKLEVDAEASANTLAQLERGLATLEAVRDHTAGAN